MRKLLSFLVFVFVVITGCNHTNNPVVAVAFHNKLYLSEVVENIPFAVSKEDSLIFMEQFVDEWILRQTLMAHAKKNLALNEQNFSTSVTYFIEQLLIDKYLQKIGRDSSRFSVPKQEVIDFLNTMKPDNTPEYRTMVKLNYIRLSNPSKLYKPIKDLFFVEKDRAKALKQLELLCGDTIEYYLDGEHWFYADYFANELPFTFSEKELKNTFDFVQDGNRYLVLVLDKKQQLQPKNTLEDKKMAQMMLEQQRKKEFIAQYQDSLVQKALMEKKAIRHPVVY